MRSPLCPKLCPDSLRDGPFSFLNLIVLFCLSYHNSHSKESLRQPNQEQPPHPGFSMIYISHCRSMLWASSSVSWGQCLLYMTKWEEILFPFGWPAWMCSPSLPKDTSHSMMPKQPNNHIISFRYTSMAHRSTGQRDTGRDSLKSQTPSSVKKIPCTWGLQCQFYFSSPLVH